MISTRIYMFNWCVFSASNVFPLGSTLPYVLHTWPEGHAAQPQRFPVSLQKLPQFLQALVELLLAAGVYPPEQAPQHVLINSYSKGAGIAPHMDGPLYSPCVATITLGGPALMAFHKAEPDGSQGELATEVLHLIAT